MKKRLTQGYININILLVGIIVLGGFLFVGGRNIFRDIKKPVSPEQTYRIDDSSIATNLQQTLQLDTFRFVALPSNTPTPPGSTAPTSTPPPRGIPTPTNTPQPGVPTPTPTNPLFPPPTATPTIFSPFPTTPPTPTSPYGGGEPIPTGFFPTSGPHPTLDPNVTYCPKDSPNGGGCQCLPDEQLFGFCERPRGSEKSCGHGDNVCTDEFFDSDPTCVRWCLYKPVIYLYPSQTISVDVWVDTPGKVVVSDPWYPEGGWRNILANPDGTLIYNNAVYHELFYETDVADVRPPTKGIIIVMTGLKKQLTEITTRLGLQGVEQKEFLEFWVPKLQKEIRTPYLFFSILDSEEKNRIDKVIINPRPETVIEFLAYFKGMEELSFVEPLILPSKPPVRKGFTAVIWGGTIDSQKNY